MAETLLTVKHLVKQYGDHIVLNDISLDIKKGEVIVVVGPSGCGKSTLLRCINALEPIQGGVIKLGDIPIEAKSKSLISLRQKIGMVFQSYDLFPHLTVLDNILLAPMKVQKRKKEEVTEEAMKLLRKVGLQEQAGKFPRELLDVILNLAAQGNTMVIVTHEMQFARAVADRVVFLDDGKIIEEEPPEIFFRNPKTERAKRFLSTFTFHAVKR